MSQPTRYWQITGTDKYIDQVIQFSLQEQNAIQIAQIELSHHKNPRSYGSTDPCPNDSYMVAIFPGLPFEFVYKIDTVNKKLVFINCEKIQITHSFSTD